MKIETILFDLDGTLIDTNELILESFRHTFNYYGYQFTNDELLTFNGPPLIDTFSSLDKYKADEMISTYREHNLAHHNDYVRLFPNVKETLEKLSKSNLKLGIVSTKMRTGVNLGLKVTGLEDFFEHIITIDDVHNAKPHPEPVLKGMNRLGGNPDTTLMVGDNYHDIEAGKNAGVHTAGVAWSGKGKEFLQQFKPTFMLDDMNDLLGIAGVQK